MSAVITVFRPSIARAASVWTDRARNCTSQFGHGTVTPLSSSLSRRLKKRKKRILLLLLLLIFFNTSLLQAYMQGALEDMRHWYSQHFISHEHGMNEHFISHKHGMNEHFVSQSSNLLPCLIVVKFVRRSFTDVSCTPIGVSDPPLPPPPPPRPL